MQVSFDGLEGNWSTGLGQYGRALFTKTWFDRLSPALQGRVINDASNPGHFAWHIYTRMNWGEPWYAGFRESQTQYRLHNRREQPGMITTTEFTFDSSHAAQPLQFIVRVAGKHEAGEILLELDGREAMTLATPLPSSQILRYAGGDSLVRCNAQGHPLESIPVNQKRLLVASGKTLIRVGARLAAGDDTGLKCEFRTIGAPQRLNQPAATGAVNGPRRTGLDRMAPMPYFCWHENDTPHR